MFEHASLQEAYTGALIAGKGKTLNNIKMVMTQSKFKTEEWTRVRFGAGTPWRRCWCVVSPPDEKEIQKAQKATKKRSAYDRTVPVLRGDVKFYDTKKTKKVVPIATIKDAYSAYAIYPQSKPLIEQSTLVKIEGKITIHSKPETTTDGFIFVMPEVHPAISGFEMLLRFLFPLWDVFALYGRPTRLIPDTLDTRSLMFAMPQEKRYGYLEILDVATLIHTGGSQGWDEKEWKNQLKQLTSQRINKMSRNRSQTSSQAGSRHGHRNSLPSRTAALRFQDNASMRSTPSLHQNDELKPPPIPHTDSAPPGSSQFQSPPPAISPTKSMGHQRSVSESTPMASPRRQRGLTEGGEYTPSRLSRETSRPRLSSDDDAPPPPAHGVPVVPAHYRSQSPKYPMEQSEGLQYRSSSESDRKYHDAVELEGDVGRGMIPNRPPSPVASPPAFSHEPGAKPPTRPYHSPELRRANSRMSSTTLSQLAAAGNAGNGSAVGVSVGAATAGAAAAAAWMTNPQSREEHYPDERSQRGVNDYNDSSRTSADNRLQNQGMVSVESGRSQSRSPRRTAYNSPQPPEQSYGQYGSANSQVNGLQTPLANQPRSVSPLSQTSTVSPVKESAKPDTHQENPSRPTSNQQQFSPQPSPSKSQRPVSSRPLSVSKIARKPLPTPAKSNDIPQSQDRQSLEEMRRQDVDNAAINRVHTMNSVTSTEGSLRRYSGDSSHYDTDSVASPNYDSPQASISGKQLPSLTDKPRTGVLKTVGTPDPSQKDIVVGDGRYRSEPKIESDIPEIDFGPTQIYRPEVQSSQPRSKSRDRLGANARNDGSVSSLYRQGRVSPGHVIDAYNRSPGRSALATPEPSQSRSGSAGSEDNRRSMAWQPAAAGGSSNQAPKQTITPEQFVQQRATASQVVPVYAHNRQTSGTPPLTYSRQNSRTPPLNSRNSSGDWSGQYGHESPARPTSRGASTIINAPVQDYSNHLSAREQEHVARVTGSPLINMASKNPTRRPSSSGLIGAIEAREEEKKAIKAGMGGQMVQQAIAQRQQQAQSYRPQPSPQMHMPGQFPLTPQTPQGGWSSYQQPYQGSGQVSSGYYQQPSQYQQGQFTQGQSQYAQGQYSQSQYAQNQYQVPQQQSQYQQGQYTTGQYQQAQQQQQQGQYQQSQYQGQYSNQGYFGR